MMKCHYAKKLFKLNIIVYLLFVFSSPIFSQTNNENIINDEESISDSLQKVFYYYDLAKNFKSTNLDLAIFYNKKALTLANKIKSPTACALTNEFMGELFKQNHSFQPAINYYLISAKIYESNNNIEKLVGIYLKLGELYLSNNFNIQLAHSYYNKALGLAISTNDKDLIANNYNEIGGLFFYQQNFEEALEYYLKAYDFWKSINNLNGTARALNNIGEVYRQENKLSKAKEYYSKSFEINEQIGSLRNKAANLENMGMIESAEGNTIKAFEFYEQSLELYSNNNLPDDQIQILILMGKEYLNINLPDQAYRYFYDAYEKSKESNDLRKISESALGISNSFEEMQDHENAFKYFKIHSQTNDSIVSSLKIDQMAIMQSQFLNDLSKKEIQLKENDIALLENQKRIDTINLRFMIFVVLVLFATAILIVVRQRMRSAKERLLRQKDIEIHKTQSELMEIELKAKDKDLINFALHLIQKNNILKQLKTDLKSLSKNVDNETAKKIKELILNFQQNPQVQEEMAEFQQKVDQTYSDFFVKLNAKYPGLTKNEERLCAMLRLNLSSKEIASLNNISVKAVEMSRYRLRKKCEIENNQLLPNLLQDL